MSTFYIENNAEIFPAHYTWKVAEKGYKMAFKMNKPAIIMHGTQNKVNMRYLPPIFPRDRIICESCHFKLLFYKNLRI